MSGKDILPVEVTDSEQTPIVVGHSYNEIMNRWDIEIIVGNFKTEHSAKAASRRLVRMVEKELGFRPTKLAARH